MTVPLVLTVVMGLCDITGTLLRSSLVSVINAGAHSRKNPDQALGESKEDFSRLYRFNIVYAGVCAFGGVYIWWQNLCKVFF